MCQKRTRQIKNATLMARLREIRRQQRLQQAAAPATPSTPSTPSAPLPVVHQPPVARTAQNRLILELALKTIILMHKNRIIKQRVIALQKETSEYVASIRNNPEKRQQFENLRRYGLAPPPIPVPVQSAMEHEDVVVKAEPDE